MRWRWTLPATIAAALAVGVFAAFWPTLENGFVNWDDDLNLLDNPRFRGFTPDHLHWMLATRLGGHRQPLTWLSFALDHRLWGMDPMGYHLTSLLLHVANALAFYALALALLRRAVAPASRTALHLTAGLAAALFAVHPLRVESVAWASERRDVLSGLFWLLALLAYLRMVAATGPARRGWLLASLASLVLSLAAKAWGMTFPVVLLILDAYPLRRLRRGTLVAVLWEKLPFAVLALAGGALALDAQRSVEEMRTLTEHPLPARVAQAADASWSYLGKTLMPWPLWPAYLLEPDLDPTRLRYVASLLAFAIAAAVLVRLRRRWPWALAASATYLVVLAPVLGLTQVGPQALADRYTYLACLPWALLAAAGALQRWCDSGRPGVRAVTGITAAAGVTMLGVLTHQQTRIWADSRTLWNHVLRHDPQNWVALTNRGWAAGDPAAAIRDYTAAIAANPGFYPAWYNRGDAHQALGNHAAAISDFTRALALRPDDPRAWNNRGWARESMGDLDGAADDYERALGLAPPGWVHRALVEDNRARVHARLSRER